MIKQSLLIWSAQRLVGCAGFAVAAAALFYLAIAGDNGATDVWSGIFLGHIPTLSADVFLQWRAVSWCVFGDSILMFIYLLLKEILKRHNYDLGTVGDDLPRTDPILIWASKIFINYIAAIVIIAGGTLLFIPVQHMSLRAYWSDFKDLWIEGGLALSIVFVIQIAGEIVKNGLGGSKKKT